MRRLPVFFVLDCSESMVGGNLDRMKKGIQQIVADLRKDPHCLETVHISIIAFAGKAKTIVPLIDLISFYPPQLPIGGGTSLGAALRELRQQINITVKRSTAEQKGDWKPIVYLLTDGCPTDEVTEEIKIWHEQYSTKANLVAISLGLSANVSVLRKLTDNVLFFNENKEDDFVRFIHWITVSVSAHSQSINKDQVVLSDYSNIVSLSKADQTVDSSKYYDDNCVVLVGKCSNTAHPYLMKYESLGDTIYSYNDTPKQYKLVGCYPVDEEYFAWSDEREMTLQVNTNQLIHTPRCPHCENESAFAMCGCGHLMCLGRLGEATCPWCHRHVRFNMERQNDDFDVIRGRG